MVLCGPCTQLRRPPTVGAESARHWWPPGTGRKHVTRIRVRETTSTAATSCAAGSWNASTTNAPTSAAPDPVFFQCKRYRGSVGSSAVRDFRGAMAGRGDKGLLITTGTFTTDARAEASRDGAPPIDLIDGDRLCDLLRTYQPVQPPHHQRVPHPQLIEPRQLRTVRPGTAGGTRPNPGTPRGPQRVLLQRRGLLSGGHPRIT